jgi:hypothetical protein
MPLLGWKLALAIDKSFQIAVRKPYQPANLAVRNPLL